LLAWLGASDHIQTAVTLLGKTLPLLAMTIVFSVFSRLLVLTNVILTPVTNCPRRGLEEVVSPAQNQPSVFWGAHGA